ncbi:MAG: hypothetical protein IJZ38_03040 [Bacteroides sp.]|nr:hypothetical protein [Bacteroides sp.]
MKHILSFLITLLLMVACGRPSGNAPLSAELQRAEDLMYPHPDSALHILQAMTPPTDELNHATWALLLTQAKYKCDVKQSDSLVNIAYDYFKEGDNAQRNALASYLKGGLLDEKNQADKALIFYLEAAKECEYINDNLLNYLINAHIARIYSHRDLHDYAISYRKNAIKYAEILNEYRYIGDSFLGMARAYSAKKEYQKAIEYYDRAIGLKDISSAKIKSEYALQEKIDVLIRLKDYNEALNLAKKLDNSFLTLPACATLGHLYYKLNQIDSAYFYLNKATKSNNIYTKQGVYQALFNITKNKKDYEKNANISVKLWKINDSINKIDRNKALIEMQEKYDQQRVKDEMTAKMTLQKQRIMMGIGVAVLILCFIAYRIRIRNKERITRLAEAEERIETLNHLLEEAQKEPSPDAGQDDTFFKRILLQQLGIIRMVANTPTAQNQALLRRLAETGNDEMPAEELIAWKDLYPIIDRLYDNFYTRLMERFGSVLTDKEVQTCCLLCAGFSTKEIAVITRQASNTVYSRKTSARQKMGAPDGADIVEWVKNL